jgi:hypothetical protein
MSNITIRLESTQAEIILKQVGRVEALRHSDAVQDFLQTLSTKLFDAAERADRKAKVITRHKSSP